MRRLATAVLALALGVVLGSAVVSRGTIVCTALGTLTLNLNLCKPAPGEQIQWAAAINNNFDLLDAAVGAGITLAGDTQFLYNKAGAIGGTIGLAWNATTKTATLGAPSTGALQALALGGVASNPWDGANAPVYVYGNDYGVNIDLYEAKTSATDFPALTFMRARGTIAAPTTLVSNDEIGRIQFIGIDPARAPVESSYVRFAAGGGIATGIMPGFMEFHVHDSSGGDVMGLQIDADGSWRTTRIATNLTAPGAGFARFQVVCSPGGKAALIMFAGTSTTGTLIATGVGGGVSGC